MKSKFSLLAALILLLTVIFTSSGPALTAGPAATVYWNKLKQPIDGFGISEAFHQANNIHLFPEPQKTEIMDLLFSTTKGAGFSIVRNMVGDGGDWGNAIDGPTPTIEPSEGVWWDWDPKNDDQVWLMQACMNTYGVTRFLSTVWSPPAWMKTNRNVINGGYLAKDKYQQFADYLAEYVNGYKKHFGIDIYAVSIANEPDFSAGYSSCQWTSDQIKDFVGGYLQPTFQSKNVAAKIMVNETTGFSESLITKALKDAKAGPAIDIVGVHGYGSPASKLPVTKNKGKVIWETEVSNLKKNDATINDGLIWAKTVHDYMTITEVNAYLYWWGACYKTDGGESLIRMDMDSKKYYADKRLYTIGNFSRFVRPGWTRIEATAKPVSNVYLTAYKDSAGGKFAIVVINMNNTAKDISFLLQDFSTGSLIPYRTSDSENLKELSPISVNGGKFIAPLSPNSVTTFTGSAKM
jgi:glucuronoarabinoxylan endo-1,4-beta-xylanase